MLALGLSGAACEGLVLDPAQVIALELSAPPATLVVGDTVRLTARALNTRGDVVPGAEIRWAIVDTGLVGFTIDSVGGLVTAVEQGSGRVQARVENLRSDPIRITVTAPVVTPVTSDGRRVTSTTGASSTRHSSLVTRHSPIARHGVL